MNKFILGAYTFEWNPIIKFPVIQKNKRNAVIDTYGGVAYFSFGSFIAGVIIPMEWEWMPATQYNDLNTLYQADELIIFDPSGGVDGATTYNVIVKDLEGVYWLNMDTSESYRKDIKMNILIMSEN
jgi:hypothetical protein